ncbi:archaetidylserine decarboxylase [Wenzhouxiangella marina]|uniref:Phosphatidylserine decarboxylase proenzyme n=1 Tax=Wenzhouxiangella marina TaxID=1579979 RepID=A0A0K0XY81_9GAMM|nr:archaetidylserine decarboxylase [Wenzhouxiangella marina]AKS42587.1 phosphatidylserine decarboxylase [Wenzhouxiangella marina]MBB6085631.1 phosphatidylserine decarboxylase [Wenzhouxiangella marina]
MSHQAGLAIRLLTWPQYLLPKKLLTALAWRLSGCRWRWFHQPFIRVFMSLFPVRLDEAERSEVSDYDCFNDFFTRALKPDARPLPDPSIKLISPSDGTISQLGHLEAGRLLQAKGHDYSAGELLGGEDWAEDFRDGRFITIYLAPSDYHRVHAPCRGRLTGERRIPGELFSVSAATTLGIPRLFARNERMVARFETEFGPVAVVMVAAMMVAGIETVWGGPEDRRPGRAIDTRHPQGVELDRGDELGRFHWGSTVIVLTPPGAPDWRESLAPGRRIRLGQALIDGTSGTQAPSKSA